MANVYRVITDKMHWAADAVGRITGFIDPDGAERAIVTAETDTVTGGSIIRAAEKVTSGGFGATILRTSALQGCSYCINAHTTVSLDVGLTGHEVRALRGETALEEAFVLAAERAMIGWIDALAGATGAIPDDVWAEARAHWAEHELVEVAVTVGATMFLNRFATGLQLPTSPQVLERLTAEGLS